MRSTSRMAEDFSALVREAHSRLFPAKHLSRKVSVRFSARFKPYNASVRWSSSMIEMRLSRSWQNVNKEILIGLFQELLLRTSRVKEKKSTTNLSLYHNYLQSLHLVQEEQQDIDPLLRESFERVNNCYFDSTLERPRLRFGQASRRTLGHYHYATDTVTVSRLLADDTELLDYVMYHELLHKHLKYDHSGKKTRYHTARFRALEKRFANRTEMEQRLKRLVRPKGKPRKGFFQRLF